MSRLTLAAGGVLAASAVLPAPQPTVAALLAIIVLGVPHGALDGEVARPWLRPRFGRAWFGVFAVPYLGLFALVLAAWHLAPLPTLAAFLAASAWHFGAEQAGGKAAWRVLARGGLPIGAPVLMHPAATMAVFGTVAGVSVPAVPTWLWGASLMWAGLAAVWFGREIAHGGGRRLGQPTLLLAGFAALPPLTAFAIFFVCVHAPAHTAALAADPARAPRVHDPRSALRHAAPIAALTVMIGAALWPAYAGPAPARLLRLTIQGLAALTLPHMLLDQWTGLRGRGLRPSSLVRARRAFP